MASRRRNSVAIPVRMVLTFGHGSGSARGAKNLVRLSSLTGSVLLAAALMASGSGASADAYRLLQLDGVHLKWDDPRLGTPADVSYGFATAPASFPDAINCREIAPLETLAPVWGRDPARLAAIVRSAFEMWSRAAAIVFRPAIAGEAPDILIGAQGIPRKIAFTNVWHAEPPPGSPMASLTRATICFNAGAAWNRPGVDFRTVLAHEIGHAIGLDHPGATGALMGYSNQGELDGLMPGDAAGASVLYGASGAPARQP